MAQTTEKNENPTTCFISLICKSFVTPAKEKCTITAKNIWGKVIVQPAQPAFLLQNHVQSVVNCISYRRLIRMHYVFLVLNNHRVSAVIVSAGQ